MVMINQGLKDKQLDMSKNKKYLNDKSTLLKESFPFLFFALLLSASHALASDYQTIYSNHTAIFDGYYLQGMKIDSAKVQENDSIFYPMKRIMRRDGCATPYGASWLGEKIIISGNWNIFINGTDTVRIKTDAKINESWTGYSNSNYAIEAKVTTHNLSSFLGIEDSVKTIAFQAVDMDNVPIEHFWNDKTIQISKSYGLIHGFDLTIFSYSENDFEYLYDYELVGLSNPAIGIQNLTWEDVWDFEPGDEIHVIERDLYVPQNQRERKQIIKYLERNDDENGISYTISIKENNCSRDYIDGVWKEDTMYSDYETIENTYKDEAFDKLPGEVFLIDGSEASTNTLSYGNGFLSKYRRDGTLYSYDNEPCWEEIYACGCAAPSNYIKGLGGPYYSGYGSDVFCLERTLVYYKKGDVEWGTPLEITAGIDNIRAKNQVKYDNVSEIFLINTNSHISSCLFELVDLNGRVLIQEKITSASHSVSVSGLQRGAYIYRMEEAGKMICQGKIVK